MLTAGTQLVGLPANLQVTDTTHVAGYTVQTGDTWTGITQLLYGTSDPAAAAALLAALGGPLTPGEVLTNLPTSLTFALPSTVTAPAPYVVQSGDTWATITTALYGSADPNAIAALQAALGNPTLSAGEQLANIPTSLSYVPTATVVAVASNYTVQVGDTWASIAKGSVRY